MEALPKPMSESETSLHVVSCYCFVTVPNPSDLRDVIYERMAQHGYRGTILIASEGLNATIAHVSKDALEVAIALFKDLLNMDVLHCKWSNAGPSLSVFYRFKVRCRSEIASFRGPLRETDALGESVSASRWNAILADPNVTVVDVRNRYETGIGGFDCTVDLEIENFRDLPSALEEKVPSDSNKTVAIFCTGGIRCEKASAWMLHNNYQKVYQLENGILGYLETIPEEENRWKGECFVFDQRVSLTADLEQGSYYQCFACRRPISAEERKSPDYEEGVSCPKCVHETTEARKAAFSERMKQVRLSEQTGVAHIGENAQNH